MSTIAIIGAGPGLGQATARRFGQEPDALAERIRALHQNRGAFRSFLCDEPA